MADLLSLLSRGYFPKELPPPFKTISFGTAAAAYQNEFEDLSKKLPTARLAHHHLARPGNVYRRLGLPNPAKHFQLRSLIAREWETLAAAAATADLSLSVPVSSPVARAVNPAVLLGELAEHRVRARAGKRYSLLADVSRFYPSIYTHSIAWALHTKAVSKRNKGLDLLGNRLDKAVRDAQDGQTVGLPIGPDTSFLIAEVILAAVDQRLSKAAAYDGYRYLDDCELPFSAASEADAAVGPLQEALGHFELALNGSKTVVERLPLATEERWLSELRDHRFRDRGVAQKHDLIAYFDRAFSLAKEFPTKTVLNYAVARLRTVSPDADNVDLIHNLILQSLVNEAGVTRFALELLIRYRALGIDLDSTRIAESIAGIIRHHAPLFHGSEVAWAIWGAIALNLELSEQDIRLSVATDDPVVTILVLDAYSRGLTPFDVRREVTDLMGKDSYRSERWPVLYEGVSNGWLNQDEVIEKDDFTDFFDRIRNLGVTFYDSDVELMKINRPADELSLLELPVVGFVFGY